MFKQTPYKIIASGLFMSLAIAYFINAVLLPPIPLSEVSIDEYSTEVTDRNGETLRLFTTSQGYWRFPVNIKEIDPVFLQALLAIEDKRFYQHPGVDLLAVIRAFGQLLKHGEIVSGASTLSMQTARLLKPRERTWSNKLLEMAMAIRLEKTLSKQQILSLYLTLAPYGGNLQGIVAASRFYFNKLPTHLYPSEIALLIALPQSPEGRRPERFPKAADLARKQILDRLLKAGKLSESSFLLANKQRLPTARQTTPTYAAHLAQRLHTKYPGQRVVSSVDKPLQLALEQLALRVQAKLDDGATMALMVVDNNNRQVLAHIGSGDFFNSGQIDLTQAVRSPGSALKPFIYGLGFEKKLMHPQTRFQDQKRRYGIYQPGNFNDRQFGEVNLRQALLKSMNTPAVKAMQLIGPDHFVQRIKSTGAGLHLPSYNKPGLSIALGGVGINMADMLALYAALANQGTYQALSYQLNTAVPVQSRLLSASAVWYLQDILKDAYAPSGFLFDPELRFKTGTSFGYRDAWAIGFTPEYSLAVWVGRPDGGYGKNMTGLNTAAPVLFQVLPLLTSSSKRQDPALPADVIIAEHADLPPTMQWLGGDNPQDSKQPSIVYPVNGSRLHIFDEKEQDRMISLKAQGGVLPYHWLVNGQLLSASQENIPSQWLPDGPGAATFTLIDGQGQTDEVAIWLN